jgi:16S rRNA (guanine527-N7)-methyltransferase
VTAGRHPLGLAKPPVTARDVFGGQLPSARAYAARLAQDGLARGLIGPREVPRLWERHLLNSAVLTDLVPAGARAVDVGTGAGLPGIPMAIRRPDLQIDLVEPMARRTAFLTEVVNELGLSGRVRVIRGRAEAREVLDQVGNSDWVVARAVAPLDRLVKWCLPLVTPGGWLLALKGSRAEAEVAEHRQAISRSGAGEIEVRPIGQELLGEPTWVVIVRRARNARPARRGNE